MVKYKVHFSVLFVFCGLPICAYGYIFNTLNDLIRLYIASYHACMNTAIAKVLAYVYTSVVL